MPEGIQRCPRTKMVLPLRVLLDEREGGATPTQWAHTIEISHIGCRLGGLRTELSPGQTVTLQRGQHKASFRVIWSKRLAANENQAGIEALDFEKNIWAVDLPPSPLVKKSAKPSRTGGTPLPAGSAPSVQSPISAIRTVPLQLVSATTKRMRWALSSALLFVVVAGGLFLYLERFYHSGQMAVQLPVLAPPTAQDLARLTPKPRLAPLALTRPLEPSASRLQVAEAPTGHVVYPVAPDASIGGKVRLQIIISGNGLVKQVHVLSGKQALAQAAAEAIRFWRYSPFQGHDGPADRETSVTVSFLGSDAVSLEFPSSKNKIRSN